MPLKILREPFDNPDWQVEIKYDGFRALAYIEHGSVRLVSRKGNVYKSFDALCNNMAECIRVENAILDGEIVQLVCGRSWRRKARRSPDSALQWWVDREQYQVRGTW
jgi:ATP-dependent DNA ligase